MAKITISTKPYMPTLMNRNTCTPMSVAGAENSIVLVVRKVTTAATFAVRIVRS
jgi:hypothetical protein